MTERKKRTKRRLSEEEIRAITVYGAVPAPAHPPGKRVFNLSEQAHNDRYRRMYWGRRERPDAGG